MKSKSLFRVHFWLVIMTTLVLSLSCSRSNPEKATEKMMEEKIEAETGQDASVDLEEDKITFETEGVKTEINQNARSWPAGLPGSVPKLKNGSIKHTSITQGTEADNWTIVFEGLSGGILSDYEADLKKAGFKTMILKMGEVGTVTGEKDPLTVTCIVGKEEAVLTVIRKK